MARSFKRREALGALADPDVTPLMDLAFSLLIIFMVTTPLLEQTIALNLPNQERNEASKRPEDVKFEVINLDAQGRLYWGKQPVSAAELDSYLGVLSSKPDPNPISLRADRSLEYQKVVDVIDMIKRHNLTKLHLDTEVK